MIKTFVILKQRMQKGKKTKDDVIDGTCSMNSADEKCVQPTGWETWKWRIICVTPSSLEG
jgi:hypothetical protein